MTEIHFAAGDLVFTEGSPSTYVLRIASGEAEVFKQMEGREVMLGRLKAGDYVGEMGVIQGRPRGATVRAAKDLTVERYGRDDFLERISCDSAMAFSLLTRLSERLNTLDQAFARVTLDRDTGDSADSPAAASAPRDRLTLKPASEILAASMPTESLEVGRLPYTIGRTPGPGEAAAPMTVDLMLDDNRPFRLSRAHFRITEAAGAHRVQDLGSVLGTQVNGEPLGQHFGSDIATLIAGDNEIVAGGADSPFRFVLTLEPA